MIIDLTHNRIVEALITESFAESVKIKLVPLLSERFEEKILKIQMYEDYIADGFSRDFYWFYPFSVVTESGNFTSWVKWKITDGDFKDEIPYAYIGDGLIDFEPVSDVPEKFERSLDGRFRFCEDGIVKLNVNVLGADITKLWGKYSQTFIDEMARQLTAVLENTMSVQGLGNSNLKFSLMFAPGTYMEHISENVTYRRLILDDGVSAPRDFWIKWTRLDGAVAYSVSANVTGENIVFELGEDVSQKIREKEYRYLLNLGKDEYHNAMGRKNVTEWREIIKRAVRRGELVKIEKTEELSPETLALEKTLADILGEEAVCAHRGEGAEPRITEENDEFARAMQKMREVVDSAFACDEEANQEGDFPVNALEDRENNTEDEILKESSCEIEFYEEKGEEQMIEPEFSFGDDGLSLEIEKTDEDFEVNSDSQVFELALGDDDYYDEISDGAIDDESADDVESSLCLGDEDENNFCEIDDEECLEENDCEESLLELALLDPDESKETAEEESVEIFEEEIVEEESVEVFEEEIVEEESVEVFEEETVEAETAEDELTPKNEVVIVSEDVAMQEIDDEVDIAQITIDMLEESVPENEESQDEEQVCHEDVADSMDKLENRIRAEIEAKIKLEYESAARKKAEEENERLRREHEVLRIETDRALAEARKEQEKLRREYEQLLRNTEIAEIEKAKEEAVRRAEEERLRAQLELQLRQEAKERERLAEAAREAIEEQRRLEEEKQRFEQERLEEERAMAEERARREEAARIAEARAKEAERLRLVEEERAKAELLKEDGGRYSYTSKVVRLIFRKSVDPNITVRIREIIKATIEYYGKESISLKIRATVPDSQTVILEFVQIPLEEMQLLKNIIHILGNSGLGIAKATVE